MEESVKFEVPQVRLSGKYKIQLFDKDTNELIEEVEKHNVINKSLFSSAFYNFIYKGFINNDFGGALPINEAQGRDDYFSGLVSWLMLTKDDELTGNDDKNSVILGETIAYANYGNTSSGQDLKKGVYNQNESTIINNYYDGGKKIKSKTHHIVFDFPTDKGNGTFDNVYITPNTSSRYSEDASSLRGKYNLNSYFTVSNSGNYDYKSDADFQGDHGVISHSNTHVYIQCLHYKGEYRTQHWDKIAKMSFENYGLEYINLNVPEEHKEKASYIYYACGMFWRLSYDFTVTRYNLDGTYKDTIDIKSNFVKANLKNLQTSNIYFDSKYHTYLGSSFDSYCYLWPSSFNLFTGDDDYLYLSYTIYLTGKNNKNSYETYVCSINAENKKISEVLIKKSENNLNPETLSIGYINGEKYLFCGKTQQVFVIRNGVFVKKSSEILRTLTENGYSFLLWKDGTLFILGSGDKNTFQGRTFAICTLIPWSSHCKLPSPVTKTSTNTMKIQYDVTVDYIMPGMIENLK